MIQTKQKEPDSVGQNSVDPDEPAEKAFIRDAMDVVYSDDCFYSKSFLSGFGTDFLVTVERIDEQTYESVIDGQKLAFEDEIFYCDEYNDIQQEMQHTFMGIKFKEDKAMVIQRSAVYSTHNGVMIISVEYRETEGSDAYANEAQCNEFIKWFEYYIR